MPTDATPIEAISLEFYEDSNIAVEGIQKVINALTKLKSATSNIQLKITGIANIEKLAESTNKLSEDGVNRLAKLAFALQNLQNVAIPSSLASDIRKISKAVDLTSSVKSEKLDLPYEIMPPDEEIGTGVNLEPVKSDMQELTLEIDKVGEAADTTREKIGDIADGASKTGYTPLQIDTTTLDDYMKALNMGQDMTTQMSTNAATFHAMTFMFDDVAQSMKRVQSEAVLTGREVGKAFTTEKVHKIKWWKDGVDDLYKSFSKLGKATIGKGISAIGKGMHSLYDKTLGAHSAAKKLFNSIKRIALYRAIRSAIKAITTGIKTGIDNLYEWSRAWDSTREFANSMDKIATAALYVKNSLGAMVAPIINAVAPAIDYLADKFVGLLNIINHFLAAITGAQTYTVAKKVAAEYKDAAKSASGAAKDLKSFTIGIDELNIIEDTGKTGGGGGSSNNVAEDWFEKQAVDMSIGNFFDYIKGAIENGDWETLGIALGAGFNNLVENVIPWQSIGQTAGEKFTQFFTASSAFLDTANFVGLGEGIATSVNNFFENADFRELGETIVGAVTSAIDLAGGFLGGINWGEVAKDAGDLISGGLSKGANWFRDTDWEEVTDKIFYGIKDALEGVDWAALNDSMWDLLSNAGAAALTVMVTLVLDTSDEVSDWLYDVLHENKTHNEIEFYVGNAGADAIQWCVDRFNDLKDLIADIEEDYHKFTDARNEVYYKIGGTIWKAADNFAFFMAQVSGLIIVIDFIKKCIANIKDFFKLIRDNIKLTFDLITGKKDLFEETFGVKTTALFSRLWENIGNDTEELFGINIPRTVSKAVDDVINLFTFMGQNAGQIMLDTGKDAPKKLAQGINNNAYMAKNAMNNVKSGLTSTMSGLQAEFKKTGENIITGINSGLDSKKGSFYKKMTEVAKKGYSDFCKAIDSHSPSRLFAIAGGNIVSGLNLGISENAFTTKDVIQNWVDGFSTVATDINFSNISTPDIADIVDQVQGYVTTASTVSLNKDSDNIEQYLTNNILPLLTGINDNTKRQADKKETTEVVLDSRKITKAVNRQNRNNGYSFTS